MLGGRLLEDLAVPAQRAVVVLELLLVEARDALGPGHALRRVLDLQQADLADADQRGPVAAAGVDRLEQLGGRALHGDVVEHALEHGDGARVVRVGAQHGAQLVERALLVVLAVVRDLRQAEADRHHLALGQPALDDLREEAREIAPALGLGVQAIERLHRVAIVRRQLEHALVGGDGLVDAAERLLGQRADLRAQAPLGAGILGQLGAADQDLVQRRGVVAGRVDLIERRQRGVVFGHAIEHAPVVLGGQLVVALPRAASATKRSRRNRSCSSSTSGVMSR